MRLFPAWKDRPDQLYYVMLLSNISTCPICKKAGNAIPAFIFFASSPAKTSHLPAACFTFRTRTFFSENTLNDIVSQRNEMIEWNKVLA